MDYLTQASICLNSEISGATDCKKRSSKTIDKWCFLSSIKNLMYTVVLYTVFKQPYHKVCIQNRNGAKGNKCNHFRTGVRFKSLCALELLDHSLWWKQPHVLVLTLTHHLGKSVSQPTSHLQKTLSCENKDSKPFQTCVAAANTGMHYHLQQSTKTIICRRKNYFCSPSDREYCPSCPLWCRASFWFLV